MTNSALTTQALVVDVQGYTLTDQECLRLQHPLVAGVILFARNFESRQQLIELVANIRAANPALLVMTDQEGGRVQRFRDDGFTPVPPMGKLAESYSTDANTTCDLVQNVAWLLASELRATGIDLGLSPVLDLDRGISRVVGDRSFGANPEQVATLAKAYLAGLNEAGMAGVGKHFPGHGGVSVDSHIALPIDKRSRAEIADDMQPFAELIADGLQGIMPGHLRFPAIDEEAAGFSRYWLQTVLRQELGFQGAIFTDCLNMAGASVAGTMSSRLAKALAAGCDLALVCNNPTAVDEILAEWNSGALVLPEDDSGRLKRVAMMKGTGQITWEQLNSSERRCTLLEQLASL